MPGTDITKNYVRKRQFSPKKCAKGSFRTMTVDHQTKMVICCPKGPKHYNKRSGKCRVGTRVQTVLKRRK